MNYLLLFLICLILLIIIVFTILYIIFKIYLKKYNCLIKTIKDYDDLICTNNTNNHEIKNQLLTIRNMSKNKKVISYIDSILNNQDLDDRNILKKVIKIPCGGLRGLIYSKLLVMQNNNINYELYIDKKVCTKNINKISSNDMVDLCKIIGVFLDNSIDAVIPLKKKNIVIEIYVDCADLVISITNNYDGFIDINKLGNSGFTTKSKGHGYGLKLVRDILSKNKKLENTKEFYNDYFTQNIRVKL